MTSQYYSTVFAERQIAASAFDYAWMPSEGRHAHTIVFAQLRIDGGVPLSLSIFFLKWQSCIQIYTEKCFGNPLRSDKS